MKQAGGGSIVNISSIAGALTHPWMTSYCTAKAGVNMLTRCAADDLGEFGIRVNAVMPSLVDTPLVTALTADPGVREEYLRRIPLRRALWRSVSSTGRDSWAAWCRRPLPRSSWRPSCSVG